ncbi:cytochrome P450 [Kibdelosporangium phytohabitans]|uniref:Cytochrome n=1 Tax=Kibdelosporangium phytohabitans TaxID=860235 RepID=A0A0N9I4Q7_9PSEU|nr:cytochrome P450 [Kibdelosporangium phytohabitans]ALG13749.1 cytochrome [Kibdelosporangium phytohabitans]MBE1467343.1 cytochrome P450 [Kibdelosporangium phytohabitans]
MTETLPATPTGIPRLPVDRVNPLDPPAELHERGPLSRLTFADGTIGWLVTTHQLARAVLADQRFSVRPEIRKSPIRADLPTDAAKPGMFLSQDAPEHTRYRRLLTGQFTVRRMNELIPRVQEITDEHIEGMRRHGPPVDLVQAYALPIPSLVICEILGVPYGDRATFQDNSHKMLDLTRTRDEIRSAVENIENYLLDLVTAKRKAPSDDMLSGLLAEDGLSDAEIATMGFLLLIAGHETTANMLGLGTYTLLTNPDQLQLLREDPDLVDNAVEELLRYLTIIHFGTTRTAAEDLELGGHLVKAGEPVAISLPAANRDPMRFVNPDRLALNGTPTGHVAFGHGIHQCLGQQLARIEMRIGFATLLREFPALRLATAPQDVRLREQMAIFGVHELPVAW